MIPFPGYRVLHRPCRDHLVWVGFLPTVLIQSMLKWFQDNAKTCPHLALFVTSNCVLYSEHRRHAGVLSAEAICFTVVQSHTSSTTSLRFDLPLLSSTHTDHYAITALAKRNSNAQTKGTSKNMRSHSAIYRVGRDFFTGLQKHVSVTTGVLLCSLMFSGTLCRSSPHV